MSDLHFDSLEEFKLSLDSYDTAFSDSIVSSLSGNLHSDEPVLVTTIHCKDLNESLELMMHPEDFKQALILALQNYEDNEMFQKCIEVSDMISSLELKK